MDADRPMDAFERELKARIRAFADAISVPDRPLACPARRRILVVEDDPPTRRMVAEALADEGFDVVAADDGQQALAMAASDHLDLVVLDLGLPVLDGPSFAARWRQRDGTGVPLVVMSGRPDAQQTARTLAADAFYRKPLDLGNFMVAIHSLVDRSPRRPTLHGAH